MVVTQTQKKFFEDIEISNLNPTNRVYSGTFNCSEKQYNYIEKLCKERDLSSWTDLVNALLKEAVEIPNYDHSQQITVDLPQTHHYTRDTSVTCNFTQPVYKELHVFREQTGAKDLQTFFHGLYSFARTHKERFKTYLSQI